MKVRVLVDEDEDGVYIAESPSLPGCIAQGQSRAEALENFKDAAKGYLESLRRHGDPLPPAISEEVVDIDV